MHSAHAFKLGTDEHHQAQGVCRGLDSLSLTRGGELWSGIVACSCLGRAGVSTTGDTALGFSGVTVWLSDGLMRAPLDCLLDR